MTKRTSSSEHVAVGFMPAFKCRQENSLIVFERGHKAHGYVQTAPWFPFGQQALAPAFGQASRASVVVGELQETQIRGLQEIQNVSIRITNPELSSSVWRVINVAHKLDSLIVVN